MCIRDSTIGTLDGANVEIREEVGEDNFFLFGYKTEELEALRAHYNPRQVYEENKELKQAIDQIAGGYFSPDIRNLFQPIVSSILDYDKYFVLADYASYIECQERVDKAYRNKDQWIKMSILNVARSGKFSSDRSIREYAENIWSILPVPL